MNGYSLQFASEELRGNRELGEMAMRDHPLALRNVTPELRSELLPLALQLTRAGRASRALWFVALQVTLLSGRSCMQFYARCTMLSFPCLCWVCLSTSFSDDKWKAAFCLPLQLWKGSGCQVTGAPYKKLVPWD